jgi:hypothetical protein
MASIMDVNSEEGGVVNSGTNLTGLTIKGRWAVLHLVEQ